MSRYSSRVLFPAVLSVMILGVTVAAEKDVKRLLYVTVPDGAGGSRGRGILVFDIDDGHKLVKQIDIPDIGGTRGVCASAVSNRLFCSHSNTKVFCMDLITEKRLWENVYEKSEGGCDRIVVTPDGKQLYVPSGWWSKDPHWKVLDGSTGKLITKIRIAPGAHDLICSLDGRRVYGGSTKFNMLAVVSTESNTVVKEIGPFMGEIYPFTVNGKQTLCYVNTDGLVGFEIGDLKTGQKLHQVRVKGMEDQRRRCHGIGMTPDEEEIWLVDQDRKRLWLFDATVMPPKQIGHIDVSAKTHGWITFSIDGRFGYPDSGDVIDTKTKKIITTLKDADGNQVRSSKFIEIHFRDGDPVRVGHQMGVGRATDAAAGERG